MNDVVLTLHRRVFFFAGGTNPVDVHVHQGADLRWRWVANVQHSGPEEPVAVSPVRGWESEPEAEGAARGFFAILGLTLQEVSQ